MSAQPIFKSPAGEKAVMTWYDSMLANWPVPHETFHLSTRHGDTFVIASGNESSSPLILLHGAGSNSAMWIGDVPGYSRGHRVYAVDLLGEPGKSAPIRPAWKGPAYAEWLEDIFNALKLEKATLLGISQGGWTALKFAVHQPERVIQLVLLTPGGITPDKPWFVWRALPLMLMGQWGLRRINRMVMGNQPIPQEVETATLLLMTHFNARIGALPIFSDADLQRLVMPVLLLMGSQDALRDPEKIVARMEHLVSHLTKIIVPGAGHALMNTAVHVLPFLVPAGRA
jgi:pimeloyl-ACP methyl ester carboxylesterase